MQDTMAIDTVISELGLTVSSKFVPWSQSRSYKPNGKMIDRSLNWLVTLSKDGREILTTDYSAGIAHCPSYKTKRGITHFTLYDAEKIEFETENGKQAYGNHITYPGKPILPDTKDVLYNLMMDSSVLDYSSFEQWASDSGYDTDSRKVEMIYNACLSIALKLRNGIGEDGLERLRVAFQDY